MLKSDLLFYLFYIGEKNKYSYKIELPVAYLISHKAQLLAGAYAYFGSSKKKEKAY